MNDLLRIARLKIALQRAFLGRAILIFTIAPALVICSKNDNTGCGFRVHTAATNIWVEDSSTGGRSAEDILLDLIGYFSLINS